MMSHYYFSRGAIHKPRSHFFQYRPSYIHTYIEYHNTTYFCSLRQWGMRQNVSTWSTTTPYVDDALKKTVGHFIIEWIILRKKVFKISLTKKSMYPFFFLYSTIISNRLHLFILKELMTYLVWNCYTYLKCLYHFKKIWILRIFCQTYRKHIFMFKIVHVLLRWNYHQSKEKS